MPIEQILPFLCICRTCTLNLQLRSLAKASHILCRDISLRPVAPKAEITDNHDAKNEAIGRPMSPHITIYKFPLPAVLSITHRCTGMALTGYMAAFGIGALVLPHDFSYYMDVLEGLQLSSTTVIASKFVLAYPFTYHLTNGIRHLFWDTGKGLKMKDVYATGYIMLGSAAVMAAVLSVL